MADDKKSLELQIKIAAQEAVATVSSLKGELKTLADEAKKFSDSDAAALKNAFQSAQASAEKAAASMKLFGASSSDLRRIQNELKTAAVELVTKGIDPQSEEVKKLVDEYKKLGKSADDLDEANGNNAGSFGDLKQAIMGTAQAAATLKTLSVIKDMGAFALTTADNFQTARNQFGILLGDMEAGAGLFNEIKAFNDKTPFDLDTLTQATNVLIAAKVPLSDLQDQLTKFGDLSQGNSQRLTSYVKAFSKASAKGKADMEILNTYLDQGVPILGALAKNFNVTEAEIVEMSSQGKISFKDFKDALDSLTAAGGQFAGGMELASQSLAAMQEGLSEAVNSLAASFGEMLLPAGINTLEMFTDLTNAVNESPVLKGFLAGALVAAGAAMTVMAVQAAALAAKTWLAQAAQMGLNASLAVTNPALWVGIAAVGAATAGFVGYAAVQQKAAKDIADAAYEQKKLNDAVKEGTGNLQNIENIEKIAKLNRQLTSLRNEAAQSSEYVLTKARELIDILEMPVDPNASSWVEGYITETEKINDAVNTLHASGFGELQGILELTNQDWVDAVAAQSSEDMLRVLKNLDGKSPRLKAEIDRIQKEIAELLKDAVAEPPSSEPDMKRSWQEWFGEIANIDPALFGGSGAKAAELFTQKFERSLSAQTTIADTIGAQLDVAEILKRRQAEVQETLTELFAIDPNDINEPFTLMNESVQRLITEYETLGKEIDNLSVKSTLSGLSLEVQNLGKDQYDLALATLATAGATEEELAQAEEMIETLRGYGQSFEDFFANKVADSMKKAFDGMEKQAVEAIGNVSAQLAMMSFDSLLTGLSAIGEAFAAGENGAESLREALAQTAQQMLDQLPMMFLQAGLSLIAEKQWPLGLGFIAAAGSTAIISGFTKGKVSGEREAEPNAHGNVFDRSGIVPYAHGGAFTNQIVNKPTYFRYGSAFGVMGEAGPESIMPLRRMANGDLGVAASGGGANVFVNIINNTGAEVRQEETTDSAGNKDITVIIGQAMNNHIASGKADKIMSSRFGIRVQGV